MSSLLRGKDVWRNFQKSKIITVTLSNKELHGFENGFAYTYHGYRNSDTPNWYIVNVLLQLTAAISIQIGAQQHPFWLGVCDSHSKEILL